jgi:hypothetical protein
VIRKVLMAVAILALPLTGLAVWGSIEVSAGVSATPPLNCSNVTGTVQLDANYQGPTNLATVVEGLSPFASPAKTVHAAAAAAKGATEVQVTNNVTVATGVVTSVSPAIPGQQFNIGTSTYTLTRVDTYDGGLGLESVPGDILLSFSPGLSKALLAGGGLALQATTLNYTKHTVAYQPTSAAYDVQINPSSCVSTNDFYPTNLTVPFGAQTLSNAGSSLQVKSPAMSGTLAFPAGSNYAAGSTHDTIGFRAGSVAFCPFYVVSAPFSVLPSGKAVPNGTIGSSPCLPDSYYYASGIVPGSLATTGAFNTLRIGAAVVCTQADVQVLQSMGFDDSLNVCDGGPSSTLNSGQAGQEVLNAQLYFESNGDCLSGANGWSAHPCSLPNGADGTPIAQIVEFDMGGTSGL